MSADAASDRAVRTAGQRWRRRYLAGAVAGDAVGVVLAGLAAQLVRFGDHSTTPLSDTVHVSYVWVSLALAPLWIATLALSHVYDRRRVGTGAEEYRAIINATVRFIALVAAGAFLLHLSYFSRGYVAFLVPVAPAASLAVHAASRRWLARQRALGLHKQRTVVVGSARHVDALVEHLRRVPYAGFEVVGACVPDDTLPGFSSHLGVPVVTTPASLVSWLRAGNAEEVILADASVLGPDDIRRFAWELEGAGIDLIVAPSFTQFAGPRVVVRQAAGLPLLHVEEPRLDGLSRLIKGTVERAFAATMLVLLAPVLALVGLLVRLTSRGPAIYRQPRIGRDGTTFTMMKFRTMVDGADQQLTALLEQNEADGALFKLRRDPRVTGIGRWLRRFSIDELPQLVHVVSGKMAIVGPRPLPVREIDKHVDEARRRLLVRPGLTGLWQISGRWELSWLESVRLDLHYVENWSLSLDVVIVAKTLGAVLRDKGSS